MPEDFEKLVASQIQRSLRGFGHQLDEETSQTVARAVAIKLQQEAWIITPPVLDLVNPIT